MKIDAHQHFWIFDPTQYPWINDELKKLRRDFLPADLERELTKTKLDSSIAVQARQTLEEEGKSGGKNGGRWSYACAHGAIPSGDNALAVAACGSIPA